MINIRLVKVINTNVTNANHLIFKDINLLEFKEHGFQHTGKEVQDQEYCLQLISGT